MATTVERKEYPIAIRLPAGDVAMIDRAASLHGRSRTDFVRDGRSRSPRSRAGGRILWPCPYSCGCLYLAALNSHGPTTRSGSLPASRSTR